MTEVDTTVAPAAEVEGAAALSHPSSSPIPAVQSVPARKRSKAPLLAGLGALVIGAGGGFLAGRSTAPEKIVTKEVAAAAQTPSRPAGQSGATAPSADGDAAAQPDPLAAAMEMHAQGRLDEAAAVYRGILASEPNNQYALYNLALISHTKGDYPQAIEGYKAALKVDPKMFTALYNLGLVYAAAGDNENAIKQLNAALEVTPGNAPAMFHLGKTLVAAGNKKEGDKLIADAEAIDPNVAKG